MHAVVIGGTGHVGTYLVPRLVNAGYTVTVISRGNREPYQVHAAWKKVTRVQMDRSEEEAKGAFGERIAALEPDVVIDMICFTKASAEQLVQALKGKVRHFLHCSTAWVHGKTVEIPVSENQLRKPIGEYGRRKVEIEAYLHGEARMHGFPETCIMPGHISGPGWIPLNPQGNFDAGVYSALAQGKNVTMPDAGLAVVHHVHADDVAQLFMCALDNWNAAVGESFHAVSPAAMTLRGYAEAMAAWFGQSADLQYLPFEQWADTVTPANAQASHGHLEHSPNCYSIAKAQQRLGYAPRYTSLQAVQESVQWLIDNDIVLTNK